MRNFATVITSIKKEVPQDFEGRDVLFRFLDDRVDSMMYAAPEIHSGIWGQTADILDEYLGEVDCEWKKKIADIFADKV